MMPMQPDPDAHNTGKISLRLTYERMKAVLRIRIRDTVHFGPLDPGWVKNRDPDPG